MVKDISSPSIDELISEMWFSAPIIKDTRYGPRLIRSAKINNGAFWGSWKHDRSGWYERGFSVQKTVQGWLLSQFLNPDGSVTSQALEMAAKAREEESSGALPADWIPDDVMLTSEQASKLYEYQRAAALRLKRALMNGNALDASDTGTGKTIVALVVAAELGLVPCVMAPLAVLISWERAAKMLGVRLGWCINYDKIRTGRSGLGRWKPAKEDTPGKRGDVFVFDYLPPKSILVYDECQKAKAPDTKTGQLLRDAAAAGHKILCLSATAAKDPTEMRNLGAALGLHDGTRKGWEAFCLANGCKAGSHGLKFDTRNRRLLERLHRQIFPLKGNRIRVADLPDFPETQILAETLTCNTSFIRAAYEEMDRNLAKLESESGLSRSEKAAKSLAEITKARKAAEEGKLDLFAELAKEAIEEGRSVVIFLNFRDHVKKLSETLKTDCLIWGQQTPEERQNNVDAFNADKKRVCIVSLQAGGAGLSLHDLNGNHPRMALISPSYSAVDLKQALGRCHRAGAKTKSFQRIIFAASTIEEEVCASIREKLMNIETINDGHLAPPSILKHALPNEEPSLV